MRGKSEKYTEEEIKDWNELYEYVKKQIFNYDDNQKLPSSLVLRLKGMRTGKYMENRNTHDLAKYSYKIILYTFQYCSLEIKRYISTKDFKDEMHKINYICKIVENNLNDIYIKVKSANISSEKTKKVIVSGMEENKPINYQRKTEDINNNSKLNNLW